MLMNNSLVVIEAMGFIKKQQKNGKNNQTLYVVAATKATKTHCIFCFRLYTLCYSYLLICVIISCVVCLQASTQDRRTFRTFSRSSGQSFDWPMWISKSLNKATWLLISTMSWNKWRKTQFYYSIIVICKYEAIFNSSFYQMTPHVYYQLISITYLELHSRTPTYHELSSY